MYVERFPGITAAAAGAFLMWPEVAGIGTRMGLAALADRKLVKTGRMSLQGLRRSASTIGFLFQGLGLALAARQQDPLVCTVLLTFAAAAAGCHACGFKPNYLDLTSAHSGVLTG